MRDLNKTTRRVCSLEPSRNRCNLRRNVSLESLNTTRSSSILTENNLRPYIEYGQYIRSLYNLEKIKQTGAQQCEGKMNVVFSLIEELEDSRKKYLSLRHKLDERIICNHIQQNSDHYKRLSLLYKELGQEHLNDTFLAQITKILPEYVVLLKDWTQPQLDSLKYNIRNILSYSDIIQSLEVAGGEFVRELTAEPSYDEIGEQIKLLTKKQNIASSKMEELEVRQKFKFYSQLDLSLF